MATVITTSPLLDLLSLLTTSVHVIEAELKANNMPPFDLEPRWHPLDGPVTIPSARLYEARKVAMASANMIRALVQDPGTALTVGTLASLLSCQAHALNPLFFRGITWRCNR